MKKLTTILFSIIVLSCLFFTLPTAQLQSKKTKLSNTITSATPLRVAVPRASNQTPNQLASKENYPNKEEVEFFLSGKDKKATKILQFQKYKKILLERGVPFDPNILLEDNWREKLKQEYPNFLQSLSSVRLAKGKMKGVVLADTLYLPKKTVFTGDTIILANRVVFEGKDVLIRGLHEIWYMPIDASLNTEPILGKSKT